ncbi:hypothetical protein [Phenylobacterium sp.]|uniref:hypothetical protein n=1 Tax=Phenylobacterium sp. TaxID=1871053 RepID=UPI0035B02BD1
MNTHSLDDPLRPLLWLAIFAFCVGFAGFLALSRDPLRAAHAPSSLATAPAAASAALGDDA